MAALGLVDCRKTIYTGAKVAGCRSLVGGFLFGFGMTLASGCGSKTLIRVGGGQPEIADRAVLARASPPT